MKTFILDDPKVTATDLISADLDAVIVSFEFVHAHWKPCEDLSGYIHKYVSEGRKHAAPVS